MGIAFKAPRAPIERPKPASSRFSFYRRKLKRIRGFNRVVRKKSIIYTIYLTLQLDGYTKLTLLILVIDLDSYLAILEKP